MEHYDKNNFVQFLMKQFGAEKAYNLVNQFYIGTSNYRNAPSTIFWWIDEQNRIVSGETILYDGNGKNVKGTTQQGTKYRRNSWVHKAEIRKYKLNNEPIPLWLTEYCKPENPKKSCLFGLPQLKTAQLLKINPLPL
jgi:hypothetical protein